MTCLLTCNEHGSYISSNVFWSMQVELRHKGVYYVHRSLSGLVMRQNGNTEAV